MNISIFKQQDITFVITLFLPEKDFNDYKDTIEQLGKQENVQLTVQPCPFEGVEFLYRISDQLEGHASSSDTKDDEVNLFWIALKLKRDTDQQLVKKIADLHYKYLVAILNQDTATVKKQAMEISGLKKHFY